MLEAKRAIACASEEASLGCLDEHVQRRCLAAQSLEAIVAWGRERPADLVVWRDLALASLAFAREEVLWYFLHVNEVRCAPYLIVLQVMPVVSP